MATGISLAITAIGAAVSAVSVYSSAKEQEQQLEYQEKVAANEALKASYDKEIALNEGRNEAKKGHEDKLKQRLETSQLVAKQRAEQASSNALLDTGSMLDSILDTTELGEQKALLKEQEGFDRQYQYLLQAKEAEHRENQYLDKANYSNYSAKSIDPEAKLSSSLLGSAIKKGSSFNFFSS